MTPTRMTSPMKQMARVMSNQLMQENPMMQLMQAVRSGENPMQFLRKLAGNNPQMIQVINNIQGKSPEQLRQMAENVAKERGTSVQEVARKLGIPFK